MLSLEDLLKVGVTSFPSDRPQVYYDLLLKGRKDIPRHLSANEYKALLNVGDASDSACVFLGGCHPLAIAPADAAAFGAPGLALLDAPACDATDSDVVGDDGNADVSLDAVASLPADAVDEPHGGILAPVEEPVVDEAPLVPEADFTIEGVIVKVIPENFLCGYAERWVVKCPRHELCQKTRSVRLLADEFGVEAPRYFLGAWLTDAINHDGKDNPRSSHVRVHITRVEMAAYRDSLA